LTTIFTTSDHWWTCPSSYCRTNLFIHTVLSWLDVNASDASSWGNVQSKML